MQPKMERKLEQQNLVGTGTGHQIEVRNLEWYTQARMGKICNGIS